MNSSWPRCPPTHGDVPVRVCTPSILVEPDAQGRILIPQTLREYAGLRKDVTVIGMIDHVEIWDSAAWKAYNDSTDTEDVAAMMDMLGV